MGYLDPYRQRRYQNEWLKKKRRGERGDEVREARRLHRAKEAGAEGNGAPPGWEAEQLERQGGKCRWCPQDITAEIRDERGRRRVGYDADHVVPLAEGGRHEAENMVLACPLCNARRGGELNGDQGREQGQEGAQGP